jgi:hypothetical protein
MRLTDTGNLGIGTTSPSSYVNGLAVAKSTTNGGDIGLVKTDSGTADQGGQNIRFFNYGPAATGRVSGTNIGSIYWLASQPSSGAVQDAAWIQCIAESQNGLYTPSQLVFWTAGTSIQKAMTINSAQDLLIGTDSNTTNGGFILATNFYGAGRSVQVIGHISGASSGDAYMIFNYNGTGIGSITQSGTAAVLYNVTSDQRLKTNVVNAPSGNIDDIKVRSFDWIADGSHQEYGMVAQELIEVAPYAVNKPENPDEMMGVDYSKLVPMMIKEIQDLKQRIATLENK